MSTIQIKNAIVGSHNQPVSILINDNKITQIETENSDTDLPGVDSLIDAKGGLLLPSFVDCHTHLDKAYAGIEDSGTDGESIDAAIQQIHEAKASFTVEDVHDRAVRAIRNHVRHGCTRIRTHVDVDTISGLVPFNGVLAAKDTCCDIADIEIVAFPQEGIYRDPGTKELLIDALDQGADVIGGIPQIERTERGRENHVDLCLELAVDYGLPVDMHIDETDDPYARSLEYLAARCLEMGIDLPVTASHACALAAYDSAHAGRVIDLVAEAGIDVITNPPTNLIYQGRYDTYPKRRGLTRVDELSAGGVTVAAAQDNISDGFYPYGRGDMGEVATLAAHAFQLVTPAEQSTAINLVTTNAASVTKFNNCNVSTGASANLMLFPSSVSTPGDIIRTGSRPRLVFHHGKPVAKNTVSTTFDPDLSSTVEP